MCVTKIVNWWNNLPFCQKKKQEWFYKNHQKINEGKLATIKWPDTVFKTSKDAFTESDWVYKPGDRCERYKAWFFKWITERCTVVERTPEWVPMYVPTGLGPSHPEGYITSYKVKDDDGDVHTNVMQSDLSF